MPLLALSSLPSPTLTNAALISSVLGPLSHLLLWARYEFDGVFYRIFGYMLLFQPISFVLLLLSGLGVLRAVYFLSVVEACYVGSLFASIAVYRLFLHPLRGFSGPFWARLWMWWRVKRFAESGKGYAVVDELHGEFGDVVRVGPRQLSINNVEAIQAIYGAKSACFKSAQYNMGEHESIQVVRDFDKHHFRRTIWDKGLNGKACTTYLPRLNTHTSTLISRLHSTSSQPITINDWMHHLTFDIMGSIAFGRSYNQLETGKTHPGIALIAQWMSYAVYTLQVPWLMVLLQHVPGVEDPTLMLRSYAEGCLREREKAGEAEGGTDVMSHILEAGKGGGEGKGKTGRWPLEDRDLISDTMTVQIAGSDTSYSLFVHALYYLAKHTTIQSELHDEVLPALSPTSTAPLNWPILTSLPLLDAIIAETLRMHPPVPQGMTRNTPLGTPTTMIAGHAIPADTMVAVPTWSVQRDARYFAQPHEWIPERWTKRPELVMDKRAYIPFSVGPFNCAGKAFALMEAKVFLAKVVEAFEIKFADGEDGKSLMEEHKDCLTWWLPDLRLCMVPREER